MTQESRPDAKRPQPPHAPPAPTHAPKSLRSAKGTARGKRRPPVAPPAPTRAPSSPPRTPQRGVPKRPTQPAPGATPSAEARSITLNHVVVPYTVRVSARAQRLRFVIRPDSGLEVVAPRGVGQGRIEEALRTKAQWILTTSARMAQMAQQTPPATTPLTTGRILPYLGQRLLLVVQTGAPAGRFRATMTALAPTVDNTRGASPQRAPSVAQRPGATPHGLIQGRLDFAAPADTPPTSTRPSTLNEIAVLGGIEADGALTLTVADTDEATVRVALESWYRRQAQAIVAERLALWNQRYGFTYHRVTIKEQKTRWGSCSRQGNLNFNWRLLLAPLDILDYVLIHELSHLKEQNHSPRFWAVVALACPEYRARRHWLREHGHELRV